MAQTASPNINIEDEQHGYRHEIHLSSDIGEFTFEPDFTISTWEMFDALRAALIIVWIGIIMFYFVKFRSLGLDSHPEPALSSLLGDRSIYFQDTISPDGYTPRKGIVTAVHPHTVTALPSIMPSPTPTDTVASVFINTLTASVPTASI